MYIVKAFYTNGASTTQHDTIALAWPAFSHTVMIGLREQNLVRAEIWEHQGPLAMSDTALDFGFPLAVFDLALVQEKVKSRLGEFYAPV